MKYFLKQTVNLFRVFTLGLFIFGVFRLIFLLRFGEQGIFSLYTKDIILSFIVGMRFDIQVLCYSLALLFLTNFLLFINSDIIRLRLITFSRKYSIIILSFFVLILLVDHQFYTYFQTHINILAYGLIEDDTNAVMSSLWSDHPVFLLLFIALCTTIVLNKLVTKIYSSPKEISFKTDNFWSFSLIFLLILVFCIGARGSTGVFPLQIDDSTISDNRFINTLTLNGVSTFENAFQERRRLRRTVYKKEIIKNSYYSNINNVFEDFLDFPIDTKNTEKNYFQITKKNKLLEDEPPNVIFILMESMGGYYFKFHSNKLNLFGSLEEHFHDGILFSNFLSSTQGTIYSLENIIINKKSRIVSNTYRRFESFNSSVALPFVNSGYETAFITGGKLGWRNLHEFIPNQYFNEAYGQSEIKKNNTQSISNIWGVYDEFLFEDIFNKLHLNAPQFIFALSTSNHTPYELPSTYNPYPINISDSIKSLIISKNDIAQSNFRAYQYANDCLGNFLTKLKASKFGDNTIVAVSGDHNSYALFSLNSSSVKEEDNHIVPFFLSVPEKYKKHLHIKENRYGSHKDIFPTLINMSLSNQRYFSLGNDLFNRAKADSLFYGINDQFYFGDPGMSLELLERKVNAHNILSSYYFAK